VLRKSLSLPSVKAGLVFLASLVALVVGAGVASAAPVTVQANFHTFAFGVAVRGGGEVQWDKCDAFPSTTNCNWVIGRVDPNWTVDVRCQRAGQNISGNPNWLVVEAHVPGGAYAFTGSMASYYIDYPSNVLPVRWCNVGDGPGL
jgi:hypothetical protein